MYLISDLFLVSGQAVQKYLVKKDDVEKEEWECQTWINKYDDERKWEHTASLSASFIMALFTYIW